MENHSPLIMLAAGRSQRMQFPKGLMLFQGQPWIEYQIRKIFECGVSKIYLVLGYHFEKYLEALPCLLEESLLPKVFKKNCQKVQNFQNCKKSQNYNENENYKESQIYQQIQNCQKSQKGEICVVLNPQPHRGPFSSLQEALIQGFKREGFPRGVYLTNLDVPIAHPSTWGALKNSIQAGDQVVGTRCEGRGGHPLWMSESFLHKLLEKESETSRLDFEIQREPRRHSIEVEDRSVITNINTPDDFQKFVSWA